MTAGGPQRAAERFTLAAVAIVKDEGPYIEEWIAYHNVVGVEHFFIYDNDSNDGLDAVLDRYINHGLVTLVRWPLDRGQVTAYRHAAHFLAHSTRWLAVIDLDEFIVPKRTPDVRTILEDVDPEQLVMPWRMFGFDGRRTRPPGLVIESYRAAQDIPDGGLPHIAAKSIVRTDTLRGVAVHLHRTASGQLVDASGQIVATDPLRVHQPSYEALQLNHYYTKSQAEFAKKAARGRGSGSPPLQLYGLDDETGYSTIDTAIEPFIEPTKQRLAELRALSAKPFRYGSQTPVRRLRYDPFASHARRAISNFVHALERPSNAFEPVDDIGDGRRSSIVAATGVIARCGRFGRSAHGRDLIRRLGAVELWSLDDRAADDLDLHQCVTRFEDDQLTVIPCAEDARLVVRVGDPSVRRHHAVLAVVETTQPASLTWSTRPESQTAVSLALPAPGEYVFVAQAETSPAAASALELAIDCQEPIRFHDLCTVAFG